MDSKGDGEDNKSLVLLKQGAEARIFVSPFIGRKSVVKERFSKKYRHPTLDSKLTLKRLNAEARCMTKARRLGVPTPVLYSVDSVLHTLTFEYVDGPAVKNVLLDFGANGVIEERLNDICTQIGDAVAKLHDGGLIHGDLTTSNMLIRADTNQLVLIDFGLSFTSTLPEDKAVDLYVLERALLSMHSSCGNVVRQPVQMVCEGVYYQLRIQQSFFYSVFELNFGSQSRYYQLRIQQSFFYSVFELNFGSQSNPAVKRSILNLVSCTVQMELVLTAYKRSSKQWSSTMNKLAQVRMRGRKRTMVG